MSQEKHAFQVYALVSNRPLLDWEAEAMFVLAVVYHLSRPLYRFFLLLTPALVGLFAEQRPASLPSPMRR